MGSLAVASSPEGGVKSPHLKHTCIIDISGSNAAQEKELCAASLTVFVVFPTVVGLSV